MNVSNWVERNNPELTRRYSQAHLNLMIRNLQRLPWAYVPIELSLIWLFARVDLLYEGLINVAAVIGVQLFRFRYVARIGRGPNDRSADEHLAMLTACMLVLALVRVSILPAMFIFRPIGEEHFIVSLIYLGLIGGSVAPAAGVVATFLAWSLVGAGGLILSWGLQFSIDGLLVSVLLASMIWLLTVYVSDQGRSLREYVSLSYENEQLAESVKIERDRARSASESKTRFFAAANHDLRQPLHALSINLATLSVLALESPDIRISNVTKGMRKALDHSQSLLEDLLDISSLDASQIKPRHDLFDLGELVSSAVAIHAPMAEAKQLRLLLHAPEAPLPVETDAYLLERLLGNLLNNAIKFTSEGHVCVSVIGGTDTGPVEIRVEDTGPGIPQAEQQRVFEEFYQTGNPSRDRSKGLGLGLAIVQRLAVLLELGIEMKSEVGQGTSISVYVPRASNPTAVRPVVPERTPQPMPNDRVTVDSVVLVIDDEEEILAATRDLLEVLGYEVACVRSGAAALEAIDAGLRPDLVLVDQRLPGEDGIQVAETIRSRLDRSANIAILSGDVDTAIDTRAAQSGFLRLMKPLSQARLQQLLATL